MAKKRFLKKVVIVTGSSRGIGSAIAHAFALEGAKIVLNGRNEERLIEQQSLIEQKGGTVSYFKGDVSDADQAQALIDFAIDSYGQIDIIVNNVGISSRGNLAQLHPSVIDQVFRSNVLGTIFPTQAAMPHLRQTKGSIIFISSLAAIHGLPGLAPYSASKMALTSFVESLRLEEKAYQVHIGHLQVAMTEIVHNKEVVGADGKKQFLAPREKGKVLTMDQVAADCLNLVFHRKHRITQTFMGKMNRFLNSISPLLVEFILSKNLHKFEENSK